MKELIIAIILFTLSFSKDWLGNHQNPNGKPFTLTYGMNWNQGKEPFLIDGAIEKKKYNDLRINITLPINSLFTLKYTYFNDYGYKLAENINNEHYHFSWADDVNNINHEFAHGRDNMWIHSIGG